MKISKKLSVALMVSMVALSVVGCGGNKNANTPPQNAEQEFTGPKLTEEEIQKGLEDGTIIRE